MNEPPDFTRTLADLRAAFDRSFALPPEEGSGGSLVDAVDLRAGDDRYLVRMSDFSAMDRVDRVVPLPAQRKEFLGVAGVRGAVVPVYSLAALLGDGGAREDSTWVLLCQTPAHLGLSFNRFEGFRRIPSSEIGSDRGSGKHALGFASIDGTALPILDIRSILGEILGSRASGSP